MARVRISRSTNEIDRSKSDRTGVCRSGCTLYPSIAPSTAQATLVGLCICARPCINGIDGFTNDPHWYDPALSSKVRALTLSEPGLPEEFRQRVLVDHDLEYWRTFCDRLIVLKEHAN